MNYAKLRLWYSYLEVHLKQLKIGTFITFLYSIDKFLLHIVDSKGEGDLINGNTIVLLKPYFIS